MPQDTRKITTQTLTLNGFTVWAIPLNFGRIQIIQRLEQVYSAADNYRMAARDLCLCQSNRPASCECARLLQYYSAGFRRAWSSVPTVHDTEPAQKLLSSIEDIDLALAATGIELPPFPSEATGGEFQIPNGSVTELLIKSHYESLSSEEKPTTLGKLMISTYVKYVICDNQDRSSSRLV